MQRTARSATLSAVVLGLLVLVVRSACDGTQDCNGNGILDSDDVASGRSLDANSNGVPDGCEPEASTTFRPRPKSPRQP